MTFSDFNKQMQRLVGQWGRTIYSEDRLALIWEATKDMSAEWWEKTVNGFIGESRQAPILTEIQEAISLERARQYKAQPSKGWEVPKNPSCEFCSDSGVYLCTKKGESGHWAFRCHCSRGINYPSTQIPQYKKCHADQGFRYTDIKPRSCA